MSSLVSEEVQSISPVVNTVVAANTVDLMLFVQHERCWARGKLGLEPDAHYVIRTSTDATRPHERKWLIDSALEIVRQRMFHVELLVAPVIGHDHMPCPFTAADVSLTCPIYEDWPICVEEPLTYNRPFVATDISDLTPMEASDIVCKVVTAEPVEIAKALMRTLELGGATDGRKHVRRLSLDEERES